MKRVALIGATLTGNRGAEAMATTTMARLRERFPDIQFYLYSYFPEDDRNLAHADRDVVVHSSTPLFLVGALLPGCVAGAALRRFGLGRLQRWLPAACRDLERAQVLADVSGVSFVDGREIFILFNVATMLPAFFANTPVVKLSQALGQFRSPINRLVARPFLRRCERVFARGRISERAVRELIGAGASAAVAAAADLALLQRPGDSLGQENSQRVEAMAANLDQARKAGRVVIGICPSSVVMKKARKAGWDYPGLIAGVAAKLLAKGHHLLLFPNATRARHAESLANNDLPVVRAIHAELGHPTNLTVVDFDTNTDGLKELIAKCDVVATSRFHAMVAALTLRVPVFVLGWSHKYAEVMEPFGLDSWVLDHSQQDEGTIVRRIEDLLANRKTLADRIDSHLEAARASSLRQIDHLAQLLATDDA